MVAHGIIRRVLIWAVVGSLLLPIVLTVMIGLGVLLRAVGDPAGAMVCGRTALVVAVLWLVAVIATAVASGAAVLAAERGTRQDDEPQAQP